MVDFEKQIKPILAENCLECHSAGQAQGRAVARRPTPTCSTAAKTARWSGPGTLGEQPDARARQGRGGRPDAARRAAVERRARSRTLQALDRSGRAADADLRRRRRRRGKRRSRSPRRRCRRRCGRRGTRPPIASSPPYLVEGQRVPAGADRRRRVRAPRLSRRLGPAAVAGRSCRRSSPIRRPTSAIASSRRCSPTTRSTPSTGSRSGTTCCATTTAQTLLLGAERRPQEHHRRGCCRR